ncbi:unnamed protein product [Bursaphelenchus xylophilus]|nr:unnamed protein product [Bursaphelenchus xylophilus]CAG9128113.1 unnamed protein product [Bursaphelenchus xylophilus]
MDSSQLKKDLELSPSGPEISDSSKQDHIIAVDLLHARRLPKQIRSFTQSQDRIYPLRSHLRTIVQFIRSQPSFVAGFLQSALAAVPLGDLAS